MKQIIVSVAWKNSAFDGTVFNEFGYGELRIIDPDFCNFTDSVQSSIDIGFEEWVKLGNGIPDWYFYGEYEIVYKYSNIACMLKAYTNYVSLAAISRVTGINQTLLSHYANGLKNPRRKQRECIIAGLRKIGAELKGAACAY